jgi:hypothetical protein
VSLGRPGESDDQAAEKRSKAPRVALEGGNVIEGETKSFIVSSGDAAYIAGGRLIHRSAAFEVVPQPDDRWRFTVKDEGHFESVKELLEHVRGVTIEEA